MIWLDVVPSELSRNVRHLMKLVTGYYTYITDGSAGSSRGTVITVSPGQNSTVSSPGLSITRVMRRGQDQVGGLNSAAFGIRSN